MLVFVNPLTFSKTNSAKKQKQERKKKKVPFACNDTKCRVKMVVCLGRYLADKELRLLWFSAALRQDKLEVARGHHRNLNKSKVPFPSRSSFSTVIME